MQPERNPADVPIETFADTCVKLAARGCDRAAVLGGSGLTEERWSVVASAWAHRLTGATDEGRALAERFGKTYGERTAPPLQDVADVPAPAPPLAPSDPPEPPPLLTPTFLLPPEPPPVRIRGESPWACTVPLENVAARAALPFHPCASPPPAATASGPRASPSAGTGTIALRDLVAPSRAAPAHAVDDEDTERTVMAPPVVRARQFRKT